jgi:hypothetical protein
VATLFTVTLESNDLGGANGFDALLVRGGRLYIASPGLNSTSYKLGVSLVDDTQAAYGQVTQSLAAESGVTVTVYIDPNTLTMGSGDALTVGQALDVSAGDPILDIDLYYTGAAYQVRAVAYDDGGAAYATAYFTISDAEHYVTGAVARAAGTSSVDGVLELEIDGSSQQVVTSIDNYDLFPLVDTFRFGAVAGVDSSTTGTFFMDQITVTDDVPTGVVPMPHIILSGHAVLSCPAILG